MRQILVIYLFLSGLSAYSQAFYEAAGWEQHGELTYTAFGWSMSNAGDVNGDGFDDMIVSAIDYSFPEATNGEEGKLYLFYGGADGLETEPAWTFESNNDSSVLGFSTSGGDLNGDGFSDVVAGCLQWTGEEYNEGRIYLWYGSTTGLNAGEPDWSLDFDQVFALLGSGVALDGDINNDGYNDLFLSAKMWDEPEIEEGKTWLYWGSPDGPVESGWSWQANQAGAISGFPVNYAGDVNGDGFDDVVIGANQYDYEVIDDGLAVSFYGSATGLNAEPDWMVSSGQKKCNFGHWVDGAGDVNGDGYDDVVVAALLYESDSIEKNEGRIFVYHGSPDGLETELAWYGELNQLDAQFGYSCAGAGDINNDGYDDVIGGAKYWDNGEDNEGGAFVWFGSANGLELDYCFSAEGNQNEGYFGRHVGGNADFNNDGYADFMAGAYRYTEILEADGKAFAYYGAPRPADFHFEQDTFCIETINPIPIIDGITGGVFSGDVIFENISTGEINLIATGNGGPYQINYTIADYCTVFKNIWIQDANTLSFINYSYDSVCQNFGVIIPTINYPATATFSSDDITIDAITGAVNTLTATPGLHQIYYSGINALGCNFIDTIELFIQEIPLLILPNDTFCITLEDTTVYVNISGGTFYSPDAVVDATTGSIDFAATGVGGPYHIYYHLNNICTDVVATFYIDEPNDSMAAFNYSLDSFCINAINPLPTVTGISGGTFSCLTAIINTSTGEIDIAASDLGLHIINYEVTTGSGCAISYSDSISILPLPIATFAYASDTFFIGDINPSPTFDELSGTLTASPDGLLFVDASGTIDLINSTPGTYVITNAVTDGFCNSAAETSIVLMPACSSPQNILIDYVNSNSAVVSWLPDDYYTEYTVLLIIGTDTTTYTTSETTLFIADLLPNTTYTLIVITNCTSLNAAPSNPVILSTAGINVNENIIQAITIYPNPSNGNFIIASEMLSFIQSISILNMEGKIVFTNAINCNTTNYNLQLNNLLPGIYLIELHGDTFVYRQTIVLE